MASVTLTGIKPTGELHIGNYFGAILPSLEMVKNAKTSDRFMFFIADYHALNTIKDGEQLRRNIYQLAATWLACGLDELDVVFYKQSDVAEVFKLTNVLTNVTPKGLMNRAHAYKAMVDANLKGGQDADASVNMGLFNYPILMAADILIMNADYVPVGTDQKQHVEITREIARVFHSTFGQCFNMPKEVITKEVGTVLGLDGRKMSKSYNNVIPLFADEKALKKLINSIVTDSTPVSEPKSTDSTIFKIYKLFANSQQVEEMQQLLEKGVGWGEVKKQTFLLANQTLQPIREKYNYYINNPQLIDELLAEGAKKARAIAAQTLDKAEKLIGVK